MDQIAAITACIVLAGLGAFQLALIGGARLGRFAWGGGQDVLPPRLRVASAVSIALYALFALVLLERAGLLTVLGREALVSGLTWGLAAYFTLGVAMNAISRSRPERLTMTPVALLLAGLSAVVALG